MIKAVIFDFDGLILDTESPEYQAWQEVFRANGHELRADLWADLIGRPRTYFDMYAYFKELNGPLTDLEALRKDRRARVIELVLGQPVLPGIREYLREAREMGLKIGLAVELRRRLRARPSQTPRALRLLSRDQVFRRHRVAQT
jgi:beta-phosphoglucomutase-like phosphatase (HAD superfamily)